MTDAEPQKAYLECYVSNVTLAQLCAHARQVFPGSFEKEEHLAEDWIMLSSQSACLQITSDSGYRVAKYDYCLALALTRPARAEDPWLAARWAMEVSRTLRCDSYCLAPSDVSETDGGIDERWLLRFAWNDERQEWKTDLVYDDDPGYNKTRAGDICEFAWDRWAAFLPQSLDFF